MGTWLLDRLKEPTTWGAVGAFCGAAAINAPAGSTAQWMLGAVAAGCGAAMAFMREKAS